MSLSEADMSLSEADQIIAALKDSVLFAADFPQRATMSCAAWAELSDDQRDALHQRSITALELARGEGADLKAQVRRLGQLRCRDAIPLLSQLWLHCAVDPVHDQVGWALLAMAAPTAYDALEALIEDHDFSSRRTAVWAIFHRDPLRAYDRLAPYFARDDIGARAVAKTTRELCASSSLPASGAPSWVEQDPRWVTLCTELLKP